MPGYILVHGYCLLREANRFQSEGERSSRNTVRIEEQRMPINKYPSKFSREMEAIVFIIVQIFFAARAVLNIGEYHSDIP